MITVFRRRVRVSAEAAALGAVAGIYLWLAFGLLPAGGYWSIDNGFKRIQADNVRFTPWLDLSIAYPGKHLDPGMQFVPFGISFHYKWHGEVHLTQPPAVAILGKPFILLFGDRGELAVPVLAGLACVWLSGELAAAIGVRRWLTIALTGLATSILFYSLNFWEHTLAVALALGSLVLACQSSPARRIPDSLWSGLLMGIAAAIRKELLLLALVLGIGLLLECVRKSETEARLSWRWLAAWLGGLTAIGTPYWLFTYFNSGNVMLPELRLSFQPSLSSNAYILARGWRSLSDYIFDPQAGRTGVCSLLAVVVYGLSVRFAQSRLRHWLLATALAAVSLGVWLMSQSYLQNISVYGVLSIAPYFAVALAAKVPARRPGRLLLIAVPGYWLLASLAIGLLTRAGPYHSAQEWGARFVLAIFPMLAVLAASGLERVWAEARAQHSARIHAAAIVAAVALSLYIQALGVINVFTLTTLSRADQFAVLQLPDGEMVTNLARLAPLMPEVYGSQELFMINSPGQFSSWVAAAERNGIRSFVFVGDGVLDEASVHAAAPPYVHLAIAETRRLTTRLYVTRIMVMPQPTPQN